VYPQDLSSCLYAGKNDQRLSPLYLFLYLFCLYGCGSNGVR
jgi:hypothetical protein